jgi:hypothetical protein
MPERVEYCAICFTADGRAIGVYSDTIRWASLGRILAMPRASHVEFDTARQEWVAHDARSGRIVARGRSRDAVLREENEHYTREIAHGRLPS